MRLSINTTALFLSSCTSLAVASALNRVDYWGVSTTQTHDITVGFAEQLSFYPAHVTAAVGDKLRFQFRSFNHSISQSTLERPCEEVPNGFRTGFQYNPTDDDGITTTVTVTDLLPKYYFCHQELPVNHCQKGMVFAVNAGDSMGRFLANTNPLPYNVSSNTPSGSWNQSTKPTWQNTTYWNYTITLTRSSKDDQTTADSGLGFQTIPKSALPEFATLSTTVESSKFDLTTTTTDPLVTQADATALVPSSVSVAATSTITVTTSGSSGEISISTTKSSFLTTSVPTTSSISSFSKFLKATSSTTVNSTTPARTTTSSSSSTLITTTTLTTSSTPPALNQLLTNLTVVPPSTTIGQDTQGLTTTAITCCPINTSTNLPLSNSGRVNLIKPISTTFTDSTSSSSLPVLGAIASGPLANDAAMTLAYGTWPAVWCTLLVLNVSIVALFSVMY